MGWKTYFSVNVRNVSLTGGILKKYQEIVKNKSIQYQWLALNDLVTGAEKSGAIENFRIAAGESKGQYYGTCFQDSDVGKWLEAAAYFLGQQRDDQLEAKVENVIDLMEKAQWEDGYLNTYFTVVDPEGRFQNIRECDELYCFGHLAEAAVAYYQSTGKKRFLEIICRYADLICRTFGDKKGQIRACDGHPEAEIAFVRLYEATGEKRYLDQAGFQLETRGSRPYYYDIEWERRGGKTFHPHLQGEKPSDDRGYDQSECLLRELDHPVGHAVKMCYLLSGMAGFSQYANDAELFAVCENIFHIITTRQMYITGAIGATRHREALTKDYHLPNDRAYAETCASVALFLAAYRILRVKADPHCADVMERVLYNALPAGMSLEGNRFFYVNPLEIYPPDIEADHDYDAVKMVRQKWFPCACCPPNLARLIASLGSYLYTYCEEELYIHLFTQSETDIWAGGRNIHISQRTDYPWDGTVWIRIENAVGMLTGIRLPAWCTDIKLYVDGIQKDVPEYGRSQYFMLEISSEFIEIRLEFDMIPYYVEADPRIKADAGKVAVMRGPIVYCAEEIDNQAMLHCFAIDPEQECTVFSDTCLEVPFLQVNGGYRKGTEGWQDQLYRRYVSEIKQERIVMIPYSMWGNRNGETPREMQVWFNIWKE